MFAKSILVPYKGCEHQANIFGTRAEIACCSEQEARPHRQQFLKWLARGDKLIVSVSGIWA